VKRLLGIVGAVWGILTGCASTSDPYYYDTYYYDYGYYDSYYYGYDASYVYGWYDPYGYYYYSRGGQSQAAVTDLNAAATAIAQRAPNYFTPSGCVTATASGASVTYQFSSCTPQFGSRPISGTATLNLSQSSNQLTFTASSTDLTIDGKPFILDLTATATTSGTQRVLTINSKSRRPDQVDARQTQGTITWEQGSGCIVVNAQGTSTRGDKNVKSTIADVQVCKGQCPTAGTITVESSSGTFTGTFDGGSDVMVTAPDGQQKTYDLQCQ
jgi:hypothetical protein